MKEFESKQYRDDLSRTLKEFPKEERREVLEMEQEYPEYTQAYITKMAIREDRVRECAPPLPPSKDARAREIARRNPEELAHYLEGNGFSPTKKAELLQHYTQELEESIRLISWTKRRLSYATAILEYTLDTSDKCVTSVENMIQNYLIFGRVFQEEESKSLRYGQFAYVMRSVFNGISSKEEIYERIAQHRTFGEQVKIDPEEIAGLIKEVSEISTDIHNNFLAAKEKKKHCDEFLNEATTEEKETKSMVWSVSAGKPKEYLFPNYVFQTGPLKGQNNAVGRSSWEPMLMAYADVVNKRMEDRIMHKENLTENEKLERIKSHRVELLYEQFSFPIDIKTDKNGNERPVVYILDFIDINRWRAIEVKGPLTPKAAEKIRLFKKYYVDGDFSDLSEEKKIVMMTYVQDKKDDVADWCRENDYPVCDHFSSLEVLGAYKWDHDLNNFNRYREAHSMKGLSKRQQELLQKGFFKLVESHISSGRIPDIKPSGYMEASKIKDLVQVNEAVSKARKIPYVVEKSYSTKPYLPKLIASEVIESSQKSGALSIVTIYARVLDTIPISPEKRRRLTGLWKILGTLKTVDNKVFQATNNFPQITTEENGQEHILIQTVTSSEMAYAITTIENLRKDLLQNGELDAIADGLTTTPDKVMQYIKAIIKYYSSLKPNNLNQVKLGTKTFDRATELTTATQNIDSDFDINKLIQQISLQYEKPFGPVIYERRVRVKEIASDDKTVLSFVAQDCARKLSDLRKDSYNLSTKEKEYSRYLSGDLIALKIGSAAGLSEKVSKMLLWSNPTTEPFAKKIIDSASLMQEIKNSFKTIPDAVRYFMDNGRYESHDTNLEKLLTGLFHTNTPRRKPGDVVSSSIFNTVSMLP